MDEEHTAHLQRILANRKKRGASVQRAPSSPSRSVSVAESHGRYAESNSIRPASPAPASPPPQQSSHSTQADAVTSPLVAAPLPILITSPPLETASLNSTKRGVYDEELPPPPTSLPPPLQAIPAPPHLPPPRQPLMHHPANNTAPSPPPVTSPPTTGPTNNSAATLFTKGLFNNFRHAPILISPNVRPYRSTSVQQQPRSAAPHTTTANVSPNRGQQVSPSSNGQQQVSPTRRSVGASPSQRGSSPTQRSKLLASYAEPTTTKNPFRQQPYEEFALNPRYGPPADFVPVHALGDQLSAKRLPNAPVRQSTVAVESIKARAPPITSARPLFNLADCVQVLARGDWFLKWTRKGHVHKRYFWLDVSRGCLVWGKHPDSSLLLTSSLRLADIISMQAQCVVEDETNRTYYKMHIVTQDRFLHIATEKRDKFDVWFDSVQRMSDNLRRGGQFPHNVGRMTEAPFKADRHPDTGLVQFGTSSGD